MNRRVARIITVAAAVMVLALPLEMANKAGIFAIVCFVYCGEPFFHSHRGHYSMDGTLTVLAGE